MAALANPATRYEPSPVIDLASTAERVRLIPSALKAFFDIVDRWGVRDEDARHLLGGVTNSAYYETEKNPKGRVLDADKLLRVSYLVGIFKALKTGFWQGPRERSEDGFLAHKLMRRPRIARRRDRSATPQARHERIQRALNTRLRVLAA